MLPFADGAASGPPATLPPVGGALDAEAVPDGLPADEAATLRPPVPRFVPVGPRDFEPAGAAAAS